MPQDRDLVEVPAALEPLLDEQAQAVEVHRLGEVVVGALAHRAHRGVDGGPAGQDDHRNPGHLLLQRGQQAEPVHVRHHEIGDDQGRAHRCRFLQRLPSLGGDVGGIPPGAEDRLERDPRILLVVDDQDVRFAGHGYDCRAITMPSARPRRKVARSRAIRASGPRRARPATSDAAISAR
jgi:hypothetical protein